MSDTYLAVFVGSKTSAKMAAWNALSETERKAKEKEGIAAWKAWVTKHQAALADHGTIVRSVCSRSQGQSRRRRFVSACRATSASAS